MASKHPVPSRAALNALRGVILTTSCSVILLAEERRRRLQLARAAIENARKLHMLQSNRGPLALAESHVSWESRFAEVDDEVLSMASLPRPRTSTRRRGRSHLIGIQNEGEVHHSDDGQNQSISRTDTRSKASKSSVNADVLGSAFDLANLESIRLSLLKPYNHTDLEWKAPRALAQSEASKASSVSTRHSTSDTKTMPSHLAESAAKAEDDFISDNTANLQVDSVKSAQLYLEKSSLGGLSVRPFYDDAIVVLERLLKDIELPGANKADVLGRINLATVIFQRVAAFGPPVPRATRPLQSQGIRLLQLVSTASPDKLTTTLAALLSLSKDPLRFLLPFIECAQHGRNRKALRDALRFLSQNARPCSWARGMLVFRLLARQAKTQPNYDKTKRAYLVLQEAGLFEQVNLPQSTEYRIRRLMAILALKYGDDSFANTEIQLLSKLDADACRSDIRLQRRVITRKATMGQWAEVCSDIDALGQISNTQCIEFQQLLTRTMDMFDQSHNAYELEVFLRKLATEYKLNLKHRWIYAVLDHYACRRQVEPLFSWLQFCRSHGLQINAACNQKFFARCRKFWSFSEKAIRSLEESLQAISTTTIQTASETSNNEVRRQMTSLALNEEWEQVIRAYETSCSSGTDNSTQCLRLAVLAYTKCANPDIERASILIQSAYAKGHDISEALTPLLLAKLERGDDPSLLIKGALQMGVRIHDSAYNKAAQALSGRGDHRAAADMCELAARENGDGELLYNEYNFANLVFAYTGSASYKALQSLLSGFTSDMQWWHGSRICKETIKLAMKTAAMRSVAHSQNSAPHRQTLDRLDDALIHVKRCRSTRDDRRAVSEAYVRFAAMPSTKGHSKTKARFSNKVGNLRWEQDARQMTESVLTVATSSG